MAGTFPNLSSGTVCMYPVTRAVRVGAREIVFADGSKQAWQTAPYLNMFEVPLEQLSAADLATMLTFWNLQKGAFDNTWIFPFDGANYASCQFDDDDFASIEAEAYKRFSVSLKFRQVKKHAALPTASAVFPSIATGVITQLPMTTRLRYQTLRTDTAAGFSYTYAYRSTPLRAWSLSFPAITAAEIGTLLNFYLAMGGRYRSFTFTDPNDSVVYTKVCFVNDRFDIRHLSKNVRSTSVELIQYA